MYFSNGDDNVARLSTHRPTNIMATGPLEVYALGSRLGLTDLAQRASPHLLSMKLANLSDEMAERTGAVALKKLFFLHLGRIDAVIFMNTSVTSISLISDMFCDVAQTLTLQSTSSTRTNV